MKRIATTLAIVLVSATAAAAQGGDVAVTRAEPANLFTSPADRNLLPAEGVSITTGNQVDVAADTIFTARDRALLGLDATAMVKETVFPVNNVAPSPR